MTIEELREELKVLSDKVIYFKPTQRDGPRAYLQRRMTPDEARGRSGWRRGLSLD
tara:strand:+ start:1230 stop:1394 length:165 start_codon:yes stop_codon:yes gene_type:complete